MCFFRQPVRLLRGNRRGSCASGGTCFGPGVLGGRLARNVHGAHASHAGGLGGSASSAGPPRAHLPARPGGSWSASDVAGRDWPDHDQLLVLSSCPVAAYQTHFRFDPDRPARNRGRENQEIRRWTNLAEAQRSAPAGGSHAARLSVHPHCHSRGPSLSDLTVPSTTPSSTGGQTRTGAPNSPALTPRDKIQAEATTWFSVNEQAQRGIRCGKNRAHPLLASSAHRRSTSGHRCGSA